MDEKIDQLVPFRSFSSRAARCSSSHTSMALVEIVASSDPSELLRKTDPTPMELCSVLTDSLLSILPISNANKVAFSTNEFMLC